MHPLRIGLTGGIGSGKSTVSALLSELGAALVDTDAIARSLTACGGAAMDAIKANFGDDLIDARGALDRSKMRQLAFDDIGAKRTLEAILHPLIGVEVARQAQAAEAAPAIVFDVPLLVESGRWSAQVDKVWVVDCRQSTQMERVSARSGWPAAAVANVIAQQATRAARRAVADAIIYNDGIRPPELVAEVQALWSQTMLSSR